MGCMGFCFTSVILEVVHSGVKAVVAAWGSGFICLGVVGSYFELRN